MNCRTLLFSFVKELLLPMRCAAAWALCAVVFLAPMASRGWASAESGRQAIDLQLKAFADKTGVKVTTTLTATAADLTAAITAILLAGTPLSPADLAEGALLSVNGAYRKDKDIVVASLVKAAISASFPDDPAVVRAVVERTTAVNFSQRDPVFPEFASKAELSVSDGKPNAIAAALAVAGPGVGAEIAAGSFNAILGPGVQGVSASIGKTAPNRGRLLEFAKSSIKSVGIGTQNVKGFISGVFVTSDTLALQGGGALASRSDKESFGLELAELVSANPVAAGEVVGGLASMLADTEIGPTLYNAINNRPKLQPAVAYMVAASASEYGGGKFALAKEIAGRIGITPTRIATLGSVAAGMIRTLPSDSGAVVDVLGEIYAAAATPNSSGIPVELTELQLQEFARAAMTGNGVNAADAEGEAAKAGYVASFVGNKVLNLPATPKSTDLTRMTDLGKVMMTAVLASNPEGSGQIAKGIATLLRSSSKLNDATAVLNLSKGLVATVSADQLAVGSISAEMAALLPVPRIAAPTDVDPTATVEDAAAKLEGILSFSTEIAKSAPKAVTGLAFKMAGLADVPETFAASLALRLSAQVGAVAVGSALANPDLSGEVVRRVIGAVGSDGKSPFAVQATTIASSVAKAVSIEETADIAASVGSLLSVSGAVNLSQAVPLATALAQSINTKLIPVALQVRSWQDQTWNRADELGELAAVMVNAVLNKSVRGSDGLSPTERDLIIGIGKAIIGVLSVKQGIPGLTELADHSSPTAASGTSVATPAVAYIVGSIAQTISYSSVLTTAQKSFLLSNSAVVSGVTVEKALADFVAGRFSGAVAVSYRKMVADAFADVRAAGLGNLVAGDRKIGAGGVKEADSVLTGKYEVGSVNDPETQYTNR